MPDEQYNAQLDPTPPSWLARNKKLIILGGLTLILAAAAVLVVMQPRGSKTANQSETTTNTGTDVVVPTGSNQAERPTFQRSTVVNASTTLPPTYVPPSRDDLKKSIDKLNTNKN